MKQRLPMLLRYGTVSIISTTVSLTILGILVATRTVTPGGANVIATAVGTVPSFELNRRWVWRKTGRRSVGAELGPFAALSFTGLAISTATVSFAGQWATSLALSTGMRTLAVEIANLAAFGSLWIAQFVVLDRVLFARPRRALAA